MSVTLYIAEILQVFFIARLILATLMCFDLTVAEALNGADFALSFQLLQLFSVFVRSAAFAFFISLTIWLDKAFQGEATLSCF